MVELFIAEKTRFIVFSVTTEDHTGKWKFSSSAVNKNSLHVHNIGTWEYKNCESLVKDMTT